MATSTIQTVFSNVEIADGSTFTYSNPDLSQSNYYSYSVSSNQQAVLTVTSGWINKGPGCKVTNMTGAAVKFDIILLTVTA
jgi:hypothetical protein